ncbi:MAG: oxidoreductase [Myxococcales bacterium]|nr:oxidoreductase [Myxococcales bacterium]
MASPKERRALKVLGFEMISPSVRSLTFGAVDGEPIGQIAGQWVNLFVSTPDGGEVRRSYSIASPPNEQHPERFEVAVTLVENGPASTALHAMQVGADLSMEGPWGVFTIERRDPALPVLMVGTGTGVTPYRAMLEAELSRDPAGPKVVLIFGCRTPEDVLYGDEFRALAERFTRFRYIPTLSRAPSDWNGATGYVQTHVPEVLRELGAAHIYVCGLSKMVKEVRSLLKDDLGLDRKVIHTERYD